jgi:hypothetical protein
VILSDADISPHLSIRPGVEISAADSGSQQAAAFTRYFYARENAKIQAGGAFDDRTQGFLLEYIPALAWTILALARRFFPGSPEIGC